MMEHSQTRNDDGHFFKHSPFFPPSLRLEIRGRSEITSLDVPFVLSLYLREPNSFVVIAAAMKLLEIVVAAAKSRLGRDYNSSS